MLIQENNRSGKTLNVITSVHPKKITNSDRAPSKIPLRVLPTQRASPASRMPAAKTNGHGVQVPQKLPMFLPHKQNLLNSRALSPVIPINGPRSLVTNSTGYTKHSELGIMNGNYIQGQSMTPQHSIGYIPTNIANKNNLYQSSNVNGRGATVINGNGIPLYRQASATSLLSPSSLKQGNNWKMGVNSNVSKDDNNRLLMEQQKSILQREHSISSPNHESELRQMENNKNKPGKCENKVMNRLHI